MQQVDAVKWAYGFVGIMAVSLIGLAVLGHKNRI